MQITVTEFKSKCLKIMDEIAQTREPVVVTKRGKVIAKLMPPDEPPKTLFGYMKGTFEILDDIVETPAAEWNALKDSDPYEDTALYGGLRPENGKVAEDKEQNK